MKRGIGRARALSREDDDNVPKRACVESQSQPQPQTSASVQSVPSTSRQTTPPSTAAAGRANPLYSICETRPTDLASKKGLSGTPVNIQANFFRLLKRPSWSLYQYRVDFTPEVLDTRLSKALIAQQRPNFGCGYLFDGTLLYLPKKLETVGDKIVFQSKSRENDDYVVELKFTLEVSMQTSMAMQILNLILRKATAGLKLQLVGRNYFDAAAKIDIRSDFNISLWPGYITSIRQHESDMLICCEVAHKVMRADTVYESWDRIRRAERDPKNQFVVEVVGQTVLTEYNNKTYRIDDIDFEKTPLSLFKKKDGHISFIDYYKNRYNINIRDVNQPLLVSRAKARDIRGGGDELILLIPELCRSTGLTETMRNNFRFMKSLDQYTRMGPPARIQKLLDFNKRLKQCEASNDFLENWQTKLDDRLVEVPARLLQNEKIMWGNGASSNNNNADWTNELRSKSMYRSVPLSRWYIVIPERARQEAASFLNDLQRAANGLGFEVKRPREKYIADDRPHTYSTALDECIADNPRMIVCIVSNNNADRYGMIKKKLCVERAIPNQIIVQRTITSKGNRSLLSIATKIAIQLNCKLGGTPWMTHFPLSDLMTIGIDVSVDSKDKRRSYGALVASLNTKESAQYFSAVSVHSSGEELCAQLTVNVVKALRAYQDVHKSLPRKICIYRGGVGDGHLKYVVEHELKMLAAKLKEIYDAAGDPQIKCQMSFIVVSTRINARFFANGKNPEPGTVIDDVVTLPERYDFYLVPQRVNQGTVAPTNYNVIYDQMGLQPDQMQILTYKLSHLYYNWSGTVRVPAVCRYATKLAVLVSQVLHQIPNNSLEKELYFL